MRSGQLEAMTSNTLASLTMPTTRGTHLHLRRQAAVSRRSVAGCRPRRSACAHCLSREAPLLLQAAVRLREPGSDVASPDRNTASRHKSRRVPPAAAEITLPDIVAARDAWAAAVSRRDLEAVCQLYDGCGSRLLGTLDVESTGIRASASSIRSYFRGFLLERHSSITPLFCDGGDGAGVLRLSPGVVAYSGYYSFNLVPAAGQPCVAHAKFTFVYRRAATDGRVLIALHNSGLTPLGIRSDAQ